MRTLLPAGRVIALPDEPYVLLEHEAAQPGERDHGCRETRALVCEVADRRIVLAVDEMVKAYHPSSAVDGHIGSF